MITTENIKGGKGFTFSGILKMLARYAKQKHIWV